MNAVEHLDASLNLSFTILSLTFVLHENRQRPKWIPGVENSSIQNANSDKKKRHTEAPLQSTIERNTKDMYFGRCRVEST